MGIDGEYHGDEINGQPFCTKFIFEVDKAEVLVAAYVLKEIHLKVVEIFLLVGRNKGIPSLFRGHRRLWIRFYISDPRTTEMSEMGGDGNK